MSCKALKSNLALCRNWACKHSDFCHAHATLSKESLKERWVSRYLLGQRGYPKYTVFSKANEKTILSDLQSGWIVLTKEDIRRFPKLDRYTDVYLLLMEHGFVERGTHTPLEFISLWLYMKLLANFSNDRSLAPLRSLIERNMILASGKTLYDFLLWISYPAVGGPRLSGLLVSYVPTLLDTEAAKELSWYPRDELDKLRIHYENIAGKDHPLTRYLVERWLLDLKELYVTEKAVQKIKMDQCKEELMMNRWHPHRVAHYLEMGLDIDDF
jgi:hypothetical protein